MTAKKSKSTKSRKIANISQSASKAKSGNFSISVEPNKSNSRHRVTTVASDPSPPTTTAHRAAKARIDSAGRILVPAKFRKALAIEAGDEVKLVLKDGALEVRSLDDAIREAQALVRRHVPAKKSLVKELIKERRKEAARE